MPSNDARPAPITVRTGIRAGHHRNFMQQQHSQAAVRIDAPAGADPHRQHARAVLRVRTGVRAGGVGDPGGQHSQALLRVRAGVRAGELTYNHSQAIRVRTAVRAGLGGIEGANHSQAVAAVRV
jgi:hypothetical protein